MKSRVLSCVLCATLILTSVPTEITTQASEASVITVDDAEMSESVIDEEQVEEESESVEINSTEIEDKNNEGESVSEIVSETNNQSSEISETSSEYEETESPDGETQTSKEEISETETETESADMTESEIVETETDISISLLSDEDNIASGTYGRVKWVIDADGKLTVTGTGNFKSYAGSYTYSYVPWYEYRKYIKSAEVNLKGATDASCMFYGCDVLTSVDLSNFDTSKVTNMSYMFEGCTYLEELNLSNFITSKVTNMAYMFEGCNYLEYLDFSSFDTGNVTNMTDIFNECSSLKKLDLSSFDTRNVTSISANWSGMFSSCKSLEEIKFGEKWDTSNLKNMSYMFCNCSNLKKIDLSGFNTSKVTSMASMFSGCSSLTEIDLSGFNTRYVTDMSAMFNGCSSIKKLDLSSFDTRNLTDINNSLNGLATMGDSIFGDCKSLEELILGEKFNTSYIRDMSYMFYNCSSLKLLNLSKFDTSKVTSMLYMFYNCSNLETLDLSCFNTSKVIDMEYMFYDCRGLTELNINSFDTSKVAYMSYMFHNCSSLENLDLSSFNLANIEDAYDMLYRNYNLIKIYTPYNMNVSISLPYESYYDENGDWVRDKWYMPDGTETSYLPQKLSYSVVIEKNKTPELVENAYIKATKIKTQYTVGDILNTSDIKVQYYDTDGKITAISDGYTTNASEIDMTTAGTKSLTVTYRDNDTDLYANIEIIVSEKVEKPVTPSTPDNPDDNLPDGDNPDDDLSDTTPEVKYVTVTFNTNGGSNVEIQSIISGKKAKTPTLPTKDDYTFAGWFEDEELTTAYGFDTAVNDDITLYAKWEEVTAELKCRFAVTDTYAHYTGFTYTGSAITPEIVVTYKGVKLTKDTDYTVTYKNNTNAASYNAGNKAPTVTVKGKGSYSGTWTNTFTINPVDLTSDDVKCASSITVVKGQKISKVTVIYNGKTLTTKDYKLLYDYNHSNGKFDTSGEIYLEGIGNFTTEEDSPREISVNVTSNKKNIYKFKVNLNTTTMPYTGNEVELTSNDYTITDSSRGFALNSGFIVSYSNNVKVGTAKVTFTGTGNYYGCTVTKSFKITATNSEISVNKLTDTVPYNPAGATLGSNLEVRFDGSLLRENIDYKVTYKNNKKSGTNTASYSITFIGDYKGFKVLNNKNQTFSISKPSLGDEYVNAVSVDKVAKKNGVYKSAPTVTYMGTKVSTSDYTVAYYLEDGSLMDNKVSKANIEGKACATVTVKIKSKSGKTFADDGEHVVCTYNIWNSASTSDASLNISNAKKVNIKNNKAKVTYTGSEVKLVEGADITITLKDGKEISGTDFTDNFEVEYYNNINIGKATIVVKAKSGNSAGYIGFKTATFQITKPVIN